MTLLYPAQQLVVPRPWLELYGVKIKTKHSYVEILPVRHLMRMLPGPNVARSPRTWQRREGCKRA